MAGKKRVKRPEWLKISISALRNVSRRWRPAQEAEQAATTRRGYRRCAICKGEFHYSETARDHINPIVPVTGWDSLDGFAERLFCEFEGWQIVCDGCHSIKTQEENSARRENAKGQVKKFARRRPGKRSPKKDRAA